MALWSNSDANTSAPKYAVAGGYGVSANGQVMYANTQADAFVTGATMGVFGVAANEQQGTGNVSTFTVITAGDSAVGIPTVTVTGANTTQATATVNVKVVGAEITAAGTNYANGDILTATGGTGTSANLTVATVNSGTGAVETVTISTDGLYSIVPTVEDNPFTSNTSASGTGFTANLTFGISTVTVNNAGEGYNQSTVGATASGNSIANSSLTVTLSGQEGSSRGVSAGWNLRKEGSGGRAGRVHYECLVAMGSMTGDGDDDTQLAE